MTCLMAAGSAEGRTSVCRRQGVSLCQSVREGLLPLKSPTERAPECRFSPTKAPEELAKLSVVKSSHMCLLAGRAGSSWRNVLKERRAGLGPAGLSWAELVPSGKQAYS